MIIVLHILLGVAVLFVALSLIPVRRHDSAEFERRVRARSMNDRIESGFWL